MGRSYKTDEFPIKPEYWYVISFGNFIHLTLFPVYFVNKQAAKRAITSNIPRKAQGKYEVMSGKKLKDFSFRYKINLGRLHKFTKYIYEDIPKGQRRKTYRTVMRRRLRKMGMLTLIKPKNHITRGIKQTRLIKNKQRIAIAPETWAVSFQLERKPNRYIYLILKKKLSEKKRVLFEIRALRIDMEKAICKKVNIQVYNKDVVRPVLITEIIDAIKDISTPIHGRLKRYCRKRGLKIYKRKGERLDY